MLALSVERKKVMMRSSKYWETLAAVVGALLIATASGCGGAPDNGNPGGTGGGTGGTGGGTDETDFGTEGPYSVVREDTADFVYFYPESIEGEASWPSLVWFNGASGYAEDFNYNGLLESVASWGFIVIGGKAPGMNPNESDQRTELLRRNDDPADALAGRVDEERIALAGHSLGGFQTTTASPDYRIAIAVQGATSPQPEGASPILYMTSEGDETVDDSIIIDAFSEATGPAWLADHATVDHNDPRTDGGAYREPIIAFLRWQLREDANGAAWFEGESCVLCEDANWTFDSD